jgi:hypothetical protein
MALHGVGEQITVRSFRSAAPEGAIGNAPLYGMPEGVKFHHLKAYPDTKLESFHKVLGVHAARLLGAESGE